MTPSHVQISKVSLYRIIRTDMETVTASLARDGHFAGDGEFELLALRSDNGVLRLACWSELRGLPMDHPLEILGEELDKTKSINYVQPVPSSPELVHG